jgi:ETC complex I subunit conserved region
MNVELKPRTTPFSIPTPASANDNAERRRESEPRRRAVIYKPAKSAMTSGRAGTKRWLLEFEPQSAPFIEPLMGWTGSTDPLAQVRITFPSREAAVAYAQRQSLDYEVREPAGSKKARAVVNTLPAQPMPLWLIEVLPDPIKLVLDVGTTGAGSNLAA